MVNGCLLDRPDESFRNLLLEIMELRYGSTSAVFCTQYKQKDWHVLLGGDILTNAIIGRIVHNSIWVHMGEKNMRKKYGISSLSSRDIERETGGIDSRYRRYWFTLLGSNSNGNTQRKRDTRLSLRTTTP